MSIFQGSNSATGIYQGNTLLNAVFQGTTRIWPETLIKAVPLSPGVDEQFVTVNGIEIKPNGGVDIRPLYGSNGTGYNTYFGDWRITSLTPSAGETFEVKAMIVPPGDPHFDGSAPFDAWFPMNPTSTAKYWCADNNERLTMRLIFRDSKGNRVCWYADCRDNGQAGSKISKFPIPWTGSYSYPAWGGSVAKNGNSYLGNQFCSVLLGKDGQITVSATENYLGAANWVTGSYTNDFGSGTWVKVTQVSASGSPSSYSGPTLNKWNLMEASQTLTLSTLAEEGTSTATYNVQIALDQFGSTIISNQTLQMTSTAFYDSSAGGGTFEEPPCLLHGMTVTMADGSTKLIQDVQVGDVLLSYDIDSLPLASDDPAILNSWSSLSLTGSPSTATVVSIKPVISTSYVVINHNIKTSPEHMHLVKTGPTWHFKRADEVVSGDVFMTEAGVEQTITDVYAVNNPETVYKMDVENLDVFYANGVLTHNLKV